MTGNLYVLLALARAIVPFLPTVGPVAARRSRTIARQTSGYRIAVAGKVTASVRAIRASRRRVDAGDPNAHVRGRT